MDSNTRGWAMACHFSALALFIGMPLGNVLGPLIVWFFQRRQSPWVDAHGKAAINFQLSVTLYLIIALLLFLYLDISPFLSIFLLLFDLIFIIMATAKASNDQMPNYPLAIRFLR